MTEVLTPSPSTNPAPPPPRRPHKSRLRTMSAADQMSVHSSAQSINSLVSPSEGSSPLQGDDAVSIDSANPAKSEYRSRFTEHFDGQQQKRSETLTSSKSLNTIASLPSLQKIHKLDRSLSSSSSGPRPERQNHLLSAASAPLQLPQSHQYGSDGSVFSTKSSRVQVFNDADGSRTAGIQQMSGERPFTGIGQAAKAVLDELLRRAEVTRSKMTHLNRCCKEADKANGQVEMDPWVANLLVLRQLKREVDEENRLRLLMIPIQKDTEEFEEQVINQIKPAVKHCFEFLAPGAWNGSEDKGTASFELLMDQITPQQTWEQFARENKANLVNEKSPTKDYLKINYPNKFHPLVMTLLKGKMERKVGVRKQFIERNYVLSQGGYLHQFSLDEKVSPEKTIYIPGTTIVPSIAFNQLDAVLTDYTGDASNTFEICRPATNVLQTDKVSVFRTSTRAELVAWCRLLVNIASGISLLSSLDDDSAFRNSLLSFNELESHPSTVQIAKLDRSSNIDTKKISVVSAVNSSPARSLRSVRTEESFNEPAAYNKSSTPPPTATTFATSTPLSDIIVEEDIYSTDSESFVTARLDDSDNPYLEDDEIIDIEQTTSVLIDYFHPQLSNEDYAVSIASTSTAKGHSATADPPNDHEHFPSSLPSTSDAQSLLYFSSSSPSGLSDHSSNLSVPELQLFSKEKQIQ
ncbi:hypothetical protein BD408DRAFT_484242 [Parasitella parasitica]|nr:hypothetical protein BD408DRAFT_484242 [Parasitella parasitica]